MAITQSDAGNTHRSDDSRRRVTSNIGVRRRQRPSQEQFATVPLRSNEIDNERTDSGAIARDRRILLLNRRNVRQADPSPILSSRRGPESSVPAKASDPGILVSRATFESDYASSRSSAEKTPNEEASHSSSSNSNSDSALTIFSNPNLDILPVVKTQQARAYFDFCRWIPAIIAGSANPEV